MPFSKKFHLQVPSDLNALDQALSWFDQFNQPPVPKTTWTECQTALAEGLTNAIRHAHKNLSSDSLVEIEVLVLSQSMEIRIWDNGPGLDLNKWFANKQPPSDDAENGRGLWMMWKLSDQLSYTRTADDRNCLLIVKHFVANQPT